VADKRVHHRAFVRLESHSLSLWRGGRLILNGRAVSRASAARRVTIQIRRHGRWHTMRRLTLDSRGRFVSRPHLHRAARARKGHSPLKIGHGPVSFRAKAVRLRAISTGAGYSPVLRITLRR
jgi:hypothetical protein